MQRVDFLQTNLDTSDISVPSISRVSLNSEAIQSNDSSKWPSISLDGKFVAFQSTADNLVDGDTNGVIDIFVHDRQTGQTTRVSVSNLGFQGNDLSVFPNISANGRFVVFQSWATNLVEQSLDNAMNIYVHDLQTGSTTYIAPGINQSAGTIILTKIIISDDGRFIVFDSDSANLVSNDTNGVVDVFVHDRQIKKTMRVPVSSSNVQANSLSYSSDISSNGRFVVFESMASNLVTGDTNKSMDVFVNDLQTGVVKRVSVSNYGIQGNDYSWGGSISDDGRFVAFYSMASNLVDSDTNSKIDIFVHDRQTGQTTRVSVNNDGIQGNGDSSRPNISNGGRYVVFTSYASNLIDKDNNNNCDTDVDGLFDDNCPDTFLHDRQTGQTILISRDHAGQPGNNRSENWADYATPAISNEQNPVIAFTSEASNLVDKDTVYADTNGMADLFVNVNFRSCQVPFFSQRDSNWINHPLQTDGVCSSTCSTIGACGCALTATNMSFGYYGSSSTPLNFK